MHYWYHSNYTILHRLLSIHVVSFILYTYLSLNSINVIIQSFFIIARLLVQRYCSSSSGLLPSLSIWIAQTSSIWYFLSLRCYYVILKPIIVQLHLSTALITIGDIWVFPRSIAICGTIAKVFCPSQLYCDVDTTVYYKWL
jgi:hypothetical protein